jgi:purine-binding chemotaxis protein CheW
VEKRNRELPPEDFDDDDEDSQEGKVLVFRVGDDRFALEIRNVIEIIGMQKITTVPDMPPFIKGVINLRGTVIPVVDIRTRFNLDPRGYDDRTCIIIVDVQEILVGLIVDTVNEVMAFAKEDVAPNFSRQNDSCGRYIQGLGKVGNDLVIILSVEKLFFENELKQL